MALPVTIPNSFANATSSIPLSQLDANFNTLSNAVNGINSGAETLANLVATTANVTTGNITTVNATTVDTTNIEVTNVKAKDGTASATIADSTGVMTIASSVLTTTDINGGTLDNVVIGGATANAATFTSITDSGNLTFTGTGNRITGDFSNGTAASRIAFQTSTTNDNTNVEIIPNGTANVSAVVAESDSALTNSSNFALIMLGNSDARLSSGIRGTGTYLPMTFYTSGSERMRIDTSGNVGIGTSSPSSNAGYGGLTLDGASGSLFDLRVGNSNTFRFGSVSTENLLQGLSNVPMTFYTNNTERMRIDSGGVLLVGTTNSAFAAGVGFKVLPDGRTGCVVNDATTGTNSYHLFNENATNYGYRFYVNVNGGINNYSGNNVNLSDERMKTNIEVAGGYLEKICAIPVKLFNYKDEQEGEQKTLGVIAQDVESVAPEFVNNDGWEGNNAEDGTPLKTIYTTDMMFGMMKAIQELKAELDTVKAELATLKG